MLSLPDESPIADINAADHREMARTFFSRRGQGHAGGPQLHMHSYQPHNSPPKPAAHPHCSADTASGGAICPTGQGWLIFSHWCLLCAPRGDVWPKGHGRQASLEPPSEKVPTGQMVHAPCPVTLPKPALHLQPVLPSKVLTVSALHAQRGGNKDNTNMDVVRLRSKLQVCSTLLNETL